MDRQRTSLYLTSDAYQRIRSADAEWVGTENYMGLAYFWAYEYRYPMRDASAYDLVRVHDAFLAAGLELDGESDAHAEIIERIVGSKYANAYV